MILPQQARILLRLEIPPQQRPLSPPQAFLPQGPLLIGRERQPQAQLPVLKSSQLIPLLQAHPL